MEIRNNTISLEGLTDIIRAVVEQQARRRGFFKSVKVVDNVVHADEFTFKAVPIEGTDNKYNLIGEAPNTLYSEIIDTTISTVVEIQNIIMWTHYNEHLAKEDNKDVE